MAHGEKQIDVRGDGAAPRRVERPGRPHRRFGDQRGRCDLDVPVGGGVLEKERGNRAREARTRAAIPAIALAVTVFPLNTHLAFYSSFWGGLALLLTALYAGALFGEDEQAPDAARAAGRNE